MGGMPIRINNATRKPRENSLSHYGNSASESMPPYPGKAVHGIPGGHRSGGFSNQGPPAATVPGLLPPSIPGIPPSAPGMPLSVPGMPPLVPKMPAQVPNADSVRDDRGNPATKNLFVAGESKFIAILSLHLLYPCSLTCVVSNRRLRTGNYRTAAPGYHRTVCPCNRGSF